MTDLQKFYDKLKEFGIKVRPEEDYNNYGSTSYLDIEFPDHTKFYLHPEHDYDTDLCIEVREEKE